MGSRALLLVLADPPSTIEEEFNDWYDTEHLPERQTLPGFLTARRFISLGDGPRYAAIYDLSDIAMLETPAYQAVSGVNFSPWTRRVTSRSHPVRITAVQIHPGEHVTGTCSRLLLLRLRNVPPAADAAIIAVIEASFGAAGGRGRLFACVEPDARDRIAIVEFNGTDTHRFSAEAFGPAGASLDLVGTYRPYRP